MSATEQLGKLLEESGDLELATLSEDELAALAPLTPPDQILVPLATHAGLTREQRRERAEKGEASLIDRGLLSLAGDHVTPTAELRAILAVRDAPLLIAFADIVEGDAVRSTTCYGNGSDLYVLVETVDSADHRFVLRTPCAAATALAAEIDPDGRAARANGEPIVKTVRREPLKWAAVEEAVSRAERSVRLHAAQRTAESEVRELEASLVVGLDGIWAIAGTVDLDTGEGELTARSISRAGLEEMLLTFLVIRRLTA